MTETGSTEIGRLTGWSLDGPADDELFLLTLRLTVGDFFLVAEPHMLRTLAKQILEAAPEQPAEK